MAVLTPPAPPGKRHQAPEHDAQSASEVDRELRREFVRAISGRVAPPPRTKLREAYLDGLHVVRGLQENSQLDKESAERLIAALTALFVQAEVHSLTRRFFGYGEEKSHALLFRWLKETAR